MGVPSVESVALNLTVMTEMWCSLEGQKNEKKLEATDGLPEAQ